MTTTFLFGSPLTAANMPSACEFRMNSASGRARIAVRKSPQTRPSFAAASHRR
jgi:hypothetical protein